MVAAPELGVGPDASAGTATTRSLRLRQALIIALLFGGYGSLYFCRADLSVATPLLVEELSKHGLSHGDAIIRMGSIASFGVLAYAFGKLFLTGLGDFWGGRINFLIGLGGATAFTLLFASGLSLPLFTVAWIGNRMTQSIAWAGLIKVSSKWFDFSSYGMIIGILSISYLVGDAAARQWMGMLIQHGFGWRALFYFAAAVAGGGVVLHALFFVGIRHGFEICGSQAQSAEFVRRRGVASQRPQPAAAAAAQPRIPVDLLSVVGVHHYSRNLQYLDTGVFARLLRLWRERCCSLELDLPRSGRGVRHCVGMAQRSDRRQWPLAGAVSRFDGHGGCVVAAHDDALECRRVRAAAGGDR